MGSVGMGGLLRRRTNRLHSVGYCVADSTMKIPIAYELLGNTIIIIKTGEMTFKNGDKDKKQHGEYEDSHNSIKIDVSYSDDIIGTTLCHEIIHSILCKTGNEELNDDEDLVERLGQGLWQIWKTLEWAE